MIVDTDIPVHRLRWRFLAVVEAEPRTWFAAVAVGFTAGSLSWPLYWALLGGLAGVGVLAATVLAVASGACLGLAAGLTVARLDSPATPFPTYHVRLLLDEVRAPRDTEPGPLEVSLPDPPPAPAVTRVVTESQFSTRSPHVCCPHPDPLPGSWPFNAAAARIRRRGRG